MTAGDLKRVRNRIATESLDERPMRTRGDLLSLISDMEWLCDEVEKAQANRPARSGRPKKVKAVA